MNENLNDLAVFAVVARERSFVRAAAALRLSTSALSHRIKQLEIRLGIRLLQRNSRSVSVTEAGAELLQSLSPALATIESALAELGQAADAVSGTVRITATRHAFETILRPVLPQLGMAHPKMTVEVSIDHQLRDIISDRLDAGIRLGEKLEKDMIAVRVGPDLCMAVVASTAYVERYPLPRTPQDLLQHRCINYRMIHSGVLYAWEFERDGRPFDIKVDGPLTFSEPELMLDAALDGLGVAYITEDLAAPYLENGRLVRCLDEWTPPFPGYFLYYPSRRQSTPTLLALIHELRNAVR